MNSFVKEIEGESCILYYRRPFIMQQGRRVNFYLKPPP